LEQKIFFKGHVLRIGQVGNDCEMKPKVVASEELLKEKKENMKK
jgi:hypothetical protein